MTGVRFTGVRKTFGPTVALEGLDLDIGQGELISLLGPSGCGKTTALRICAGFERPDIGTVSVGGAEITRLPAHHRNMGMVFQSYSLFPNLTVAGNIEYGLRTRKMPAAERTTRVGEMLELVQLSALGGRYAHQLSGGQQQRVALARALAIRPAVLLLDEPLSALDAKVRASLRDEIRRIQTELGITTLFVTHDQEEALGISDRVGVMSNGRLEQLGSPVEVYRNPASAFVARFVGSMNELPATVSATGTVEVAGRPVPSAAANEPAGTRLTLLVRPEDITVAVGDANGGLSGSVTASTFHGASTSLTVRLDGIDVLVSSAMLSARAPVTAPGDRVTVVIDGSRAVVESERSASVA
jgi:putative spermidine/putrescine transport system ATP-binding protein